jgi:hypothetical protein
MEGVKCFSLQQKYSDIIRVSREFLLSDHYCCSLRLFAVTLVLITISSTARIQLDAIDFKGKNLAKKNGRFYRSLY